MGDESWDIYALFLREPMTPERMRSIFVDIRDRHPEFQMTRSVDELAASAWGPGYPLEVAERGEGPYHLLYRDLVEVHIRHVGMLRRFDSGIVRMPRTTIGSRLLTISFQSRDRFTLAVMVNQDPSLGEGLMPLVATVASHAGAFLGVYNDQEEFGAGLGWDGVLDVDAVAGMLYDRRASWGSFYLDDRLVEEIGTELVDEFSGLIDRSMGEGWFVERHGVPLFGGGVEGDGEVRARKEAILRERIMPSVLRRLRLEFEEEGRE